MEPSSKLRALLLLRYTLIIATAYLLLAERAFAGLPVAAALLVVAALASNVALGRLPRRLTENTRFAIAVIVFDTAWVTLALMSSGRFAADFFMLYFFVLLLAAIGENVRLIALAASVVCAAYLFGHSATGAGWESWASPSLIRIPFLFTTAIFYGYLVERTRQERTRADRAEALSAQLARTVSEFKLLYAKAQEAERIKTEMLATVSHELRTPLTSLMGYVDLLLDNTFGNVNYEQRGALGRVRNSSRILQHAIGRMLDASRIDFGHDRLRCNHVDIAELFDDVCAELTPRSEVELQTSAAPDLPILHTDADKLRSILLHLAENACQFTERGYVRLEARWEKRRDEIELAVSDTGIGIPAAELETIFEAFRRGANYGEMPCGGVGLGLYIAQRLAARLDGEIRAESRLGMGTTFTVRLPRLLHRGDAVATVEWSAASA